MNVPYIPALSCHRCSNPATQSRRRVTLCHWRHCVLVTLWDWWQELKRIIHSPSSCQRGCTLQSSRSSSLAHRKMCLPGQQCPQLQDLPCHRHPVLGTCSSNFWVTRSITGGYSSGQSGQKNTVSLLKTEITCASARDCSDYVSQWMVLLPHRCNFHLEWHSGSVAYPLHFGMDALLLPDSSDFSYTRYSLRFRGLAALGLEHCSCQSCGIILGNSADAQGDRV